VAVKIPGLDGAKNCVGWKYTHGGVDAAVPVDAAVAGGSEHRSKGDGVVGSSSISVRLQGQCCDVTARLFETLRFDRDAFVISAG